MTGTGRGSTRPGVSARLPDGTYTPAALRRTSTTGSAVVVFEGEDGRHRTFDFGCCPLPGWHEPLADALAQRVGPRRALRTSSSSVSAWNNLRAFLRFLAALPDAPTGPADLTVSHTAGYVAAELMRLGPVYGTHVVGHVERILRLPPIADQIDPVAGGRLRIRTVANAPAGTPGYSDRELELLLDAARRDAQKVRDRLRAADDLMLRFGRDPQLLTDAQRQEGHRLVGMAQDGLAAPRTQRENSAGARRSLAEPLFVTRRDVAPLLVLLVATTGRNIETIKELGADHRVLDGRAVEVRVIKRRQGSGNWFQTATWEVGPAGRESSNPGGLYLLLHALMSRGRRLSTDPSSFWAVWRNLRRGPADTRQEIANPFGASLTAGIEANEWAIERHDLRGDDNLPLAVNFRRLRTSVEVRRTRQLGGHLPTAARSNTAAVLFSNYLRADPVAREWAQEVTGTALADAERAALDAYRRQLGHASVPTVSSGLDGSAENSLTARNAGPWSNCHDSTSHPATGKPCRATFLDCFHCGNCLITAGHLARLLSLLAALEQRRLEMPEALWWSRYGHAWAAIRNDVLPRFTPAEIANAREQKSPPAMLDLVEEPWEHQ